MSTHWGYVCQSHDPELESERWFNHGQGILADLARRRDEIVAMPNEWPFDLPEVRFGGHNPTSEPLVWLRQHPRCRIALRNEYGDTAPIAEIVEVGPAAKEIA